MRRLLGIADVELDVIGSLKREKIGFDGKGSFLRRGDCCFHRDSLGWREVTHVSPVRRAFKQRRCSHIANQREGAASISISTATLWAIIETPSVASLQRKA